MSILVIKPTAASVRSIFKKDKKIQSKKRFLDKKDDISYNKKSEFDIYFNFSTNLEFCFVIIFIRNQLTLVVEFFL